MPIYLEFELRRVDCRRCGGVKREQLDWLAANPHYTKRFALYVGKLCRSMSITEVATDLRMDWHAVKEMDKLYMREQLARAGTQLRPAVIGIDEISIRKGHVYPSWSVTWSGGSRCGSGASTGRKRA